MPQLGNNTVSMESIMKKIFFLLLMSISNFAFCSENIMGVYYLENIFGHLHQFPNRNSLSLTTMACGHPVKIIKSEKKNDQVWFYSEIGAHKGYINEENVTTKKPDCFQSSYHVFFNNLNLDLAQMYYWGRLYDQFNRVHIKAQ